MLFRSVVSDSVRPQRQQPTRLPRPWDLPGKSTGVCCHCLLRVVGMLLLLHCFSCVQLCNPMDCSPPVSSVHGIFQVRILEWVAISSSRGSSQPKEQTLVSCISCIGRRILHRCTIWADSFVTSWTVAHQAPLSQARILEWVAISHSRGSS